MALGASATMSCNRVKLDEAELWHQRLGHLNFKDLYRASKEELMLKLSKLEKSEKLCVPHANSESKSRILW